MLYKGFWCAACRTAGGICPGPLHSLCKAQSVYFVAVTGHLAILAIQSLCVWGMGAYALPAAEATQTCPPMPMISVATSDSRACDLRMTLQCVAAASPSSWRMQCT